MGKLKFKIFRFFYIGTFLLILISGEYILAQDSKDSISEPIEKTSPSLRFSVSKNNDDTRTLSAIFAYRDKETREFITVKDISLTFITGSDSIHKFGSIKTDQDGNAKYIIPSDYKYTRNDSGYIHFAVEFEGNDKFEAASSELDIVDVQIKLTLDVIDSIRTVKVEAKKVLAEGKTLPLNEEAISICVGRMFSHLKVGEITLENGEGTFEFPLDIPGDSLGNLTVIAKFEEHEVYANVLKSESIAWGIKTFHHTVYHPRSLWTAVAPIWMIVTLSIMLFGVWGHYIYVIVQLIRLKKIKSDKDEKTYD